MDNYVKLLNEDAELREIIEMCSISTRMAAKVLFPERFSADFAPKIHDVIFDLIDSDAQKIAIAAPRGFGKTSIVALALAARYILFRHCDFISYINMSHDAAALQTENLRRELVTNKIIKSFFGSMRTKDATLEGFDETFSRKSWVAYNTLVWPRGSGQQVRGVLFKNSRPGLIIVDDLEDTETIQSDDIRKKRKEWFFADVEKSVSRIDKNWKIVYIDTLKHEDSLLQMLLDAPDWASVRLEACDDNFKSNAPSFMSDEDIEKEWNEHQSKGQTDVFYREYRNLPISTEDSAFRLSYFRYYNYPDISQVRSEDLKVTDIDLSTDQSIENVVLVDPAKTVKQHSDDSCVMGVGFDLVRNRIYIRDIVSGRMYPDELYDVIFDMGLRLKVSAIGIEETSLNEYIKQPIKNEMGKRGLFYTLIWLKPRGNQKKEERIKALVPSYRAGYIYHNIRLPETKKLESQLLSFPRSKLWDVMDCEAYIVQMLEVGERYFFHTSVNDSTEDEYRELEYEKPIENWRTI